MNIKNNNELENILDYIKVLKAEPFTGWTKEQKNAYLTACESIKIKINILKDRNININKKDNPVPSIGISQKDFMYLLGLSRIAAEHLKKKRFGNKNVHKHLDKLYNKYQNGVETDNEQPKQKIVITQLCKQYVKDVAPRAKLVNSILNATVFNNLDDAKKYVKTHFGSEIEFQFLLLG